MTSWLNKGGVGISIGHIKDNRVLGYYADDVAMTDGLVEDMTHDKVDHVRGRSSKARRHDNQAVEDKLTDARKETVTTEKEIKDKN